MQQTVFVVLLVFLILINRNYTGFAYLLENNCGSSKYSYRITGGQDADLMSAPWMAYLHTNPRFICGGSLVNHCSYYKYKNYLRVIFIVPPLQIITKIE